MKVNNDKSSIFFQIKTYTLSTYLDYNFFFFFFFFFFVCYSIGNLFLSTTAVSWKRHKVRIAKQRKVKGDEEMNQNQTGSNQTTVTLN
jgi:hypothetical protein